MSEEKKYTAREAAIAVLQKAEEMLKSSAILKKSTEIPQKSSQEQDVSGENNTVKEQTAPEDNPHGQQAESGARDWSLKPGVAGTIKLAKFVGHMHSKRKAVKPGQGAV